MKKFIFVFVLLLFVSVAFFTETASVKTNSCVVKMTVTRNDSAVLINDTNATAINTETRKSYKSVLQDGMPYFENLPEGKYRVTVTKAGYMRSADDFFVSCTETETEETNWSIELYKGSSKLIVKLYNRPNIIPLRAPQMTIIGDSDVSSNAGYRSNTTVEDDVPIVTKPTPKPTLKPVPKIISGGVVNGKATNLVKPVYPAAARAVRAIGAVNVQVTIDEQGNVISASAVSGHPLLRSAAVKAARESKFSPTMLSGQLVKVTGVIVYNFVP